MPEFVVFGWREKFEFKLFLRGSALSILFFEEELRCEEKGFLLFFCFCPTQYMGAASLIAYGFSRFSWTLVQCAFIFVVALAQ